MSRSTAIEDHTDYDVSALNVQYDRLNGRKRAVYWGCAVLGMGLALLFILIDLPEIESGAISGVRLAALVSVLIVSGIIVEPSLVALRTSKGGTRALRIDSEGFEFIGKDGAALQLSWNDPKMRFTLYDLTGLPPDVLRFPCPYTIRAGGFDVALTSEAGGRLIAASAEHGLADKVARGSRWTYPSRASPLIHYVSQR